MSALNFSYDPNKDIITIEGINYSGEFFRAMGDESILPSNQVFEVVRRDNGSVHIHKFSDEELETRFCKS